MTLTTTAPATAPATVPTTASTAATAPPAQVLRADPPGGPATGAPSTSAVAPSTRPLVEVRLDGVVLAGHLVSVRVRREVSCPASCEIVHLTEPTRSFALPVSAPDDARPLSITVDGHSLFDGEATTHEVSLRPDGQVGVMIRGFDRTHRLRLTSSVASQADRTTTEVAAALAQAAGLSVEAAAGGRNLTRRVTLQAGESDLALLTRTCTAAGLWWWLDGSTVRLVPYGTPAAEARTVVWGADLLEATLGTDASRPAGSVTTVGWDLASRTGVGGRSEGSGPPRLVPGLAVESDDAATAVADLATATGAAGRRWVRAVVSGRADWRPGVGLRLGDADPFVLTTVEQVVDAASGWVTIVDSRPVPEAERGSGGWSLQVGTVHDAGDPDGAGRVKVRYPAFDDAESDWLPVLTPGAAIGKGLTCQPDVGDTVAVLGPADGPGGGVVLGGLHVDAPADRAGVRDGSVRSYGLASPDGQLLVLDRDSDRVVLSNQAGSRLELTEAGVLLHAEADLTIEAPGRRLVIRADTVDFERG